MKISNLNELYIEELRDLYSAESQLVQALPKMSAAVDCMRLRSAIDDHLEQTRGHVKRLQTIFDDLKVSPSGNKCEATEGLIKEGKEILEETEMGVVRDAAIISSAQRVEHYEISAYGTARTFAELLGYNDHVELLQETLNEEQSADTLLNDIALTDVNEKALKFDGKTATQAGGR